MGKGKPHIEFLKIDLDDGWETPEGYPDTFTQKILAMDIEEDKKTGSRTRLLKIAPDHGAHLQRFLVITLLVLFGGNIHPHQDAQFWLDSKPPPAALLIQIEYIFEVILDAEPIFNPVISVQI